MLGAELRRLRRAAAVPALALAALLLTSAGPAQAQSAAIDTDPGPTLWVEGLTREGSANYTQSFLHITAWYAGGRFQIGDDVFLVGELPLAIVGDHTSRTGNRDVVSQGGSALGNPYIGLEVGSGSGSVQYEFGLRLPFASEDNGITVAGWIIDPVERGFAWIPVNGVPATVRIEHRVGDASGLFGRFRGGGTFWIPLEGGADAQLLARFTAQGGWENENVRLAASIPNVLRLTDGGLGDDLQNELALSASVLSWQLEPTLQVRFPLNADSDRLVFGAALSIPLSD